MLCALALVALLPWSPAHDVHGLLLDRAGVPVPGATITIVGISGSSRTDPEGRFIWTTPPPPGALVIVLLPDGRVAKPIRLASLDEASTVTLTLEPAVSEALVISGAAPSIDAAAGSTSILITAADLALSHPATIAASLESVPGVSLLAEGQAAVPAIRGLARGRTLLLVDGGRVSSERRAGANASFVDPSTTSRIEIARGPASVAYGSDAFGGVIAITTRAPDRTRRFRAHVSGTLGAGVPETGGNIEVSTGYGAGGLLVGLRAREFDDYSAPDGRVPNSAWQDRGVRLAWVHDTGATAISANWQSDVGRDLGRPRSDVDVMRTTSPVDDAHRLTISITRRRTAGFGVIQLDGLVGRAAQGTEQDRLATPVRPGTRDRSDVRFGESGVRATAERAAGRSRIRLGLDYQGRHHLEALDSSETYTAAGVTTSAQTAVSIESARRIDVGGFSEVSAPLTDRVRFTGGLRVDSVHSRNTGGFFGARTIAHRAVAAVAAVSVTPRAPLTVTAQVARGFRDPTLSDRFYRGPVGRGFIQGNPDLGPETSRQVDVSARLTTPRVRLVLSAYDYRIANLVERYSAGPNLFLFRNRGRASFRGVEFEGQAALPKGIAVELGLAASRGRDADDRTPLDDVAPRSVSVVVRYDAGRLLGAYARVAVAGRREEAGPSEVPGPGSTVVDAGARYRVSPSLEVRGLCRNLFDAAYPSSTGPRSVWAPGRHGSLTFVYTF